MISFVVTSIVFIVIFFSRYLFWRRYAEIATEQLAQAIPAKDYVDLELATSEQIIKELCRRPNNRLMLLIPEERGYDLLVNIHTVNVPADIALEMLKRTYEGLSGEKGDDDDDERSF